MEKKVRFSDLTRLMKFYVSRAAGYSLDINENILKNNSPISWDEIKYETEYYIFTTWENKDPMVPDGIIVDV